MKKITFYALCLTLFLVGSLYAQQTVWVKVGASGTGDGSSEVNAFTTIGPALLQIDSAGDILRVVGTVPASGISLTTTTVGVSLNKTFAYTIEGDAGGSTLTGTANGTRMFTINGTSAGHDVTFKNIKFTGATNQTLNGGSVLFCNQPATIKFENCIFDGNSLASTTTLGGGALYFIGLPTVTITDCTFKNNSSPNIGGAIVANPAKLTISKTTFYNNKTLGTAGTVWGGAALYVGSATTSVNSLTNCTFYQNTSTFPVTINQDFGAIRTEHGNTTVTNCLFYDNKAAVGNPITSSSPSDWGSSANGVQTFNYSIGQWITDNIDNRTNFISFVKNNTVPNGIAANLASSGLVYDVPSGKVTFNAPTVTTEDSPIDFGSDGNDAGAWDSGFPSTNTWNGGTSTDWSTTSNWSLAALPTKIYNVVIPDVTNQPIIGANTSVKSLTLNPSTSLTVSSGNLTVVGAITNNGTMTLENNANLIQGGTTNTNTGNVIVKRNSNPLLRLDYTMWSSPVSGAQTLADFSPLTSQSPNRFYTYDPNANQFAATAFANPFATGTGYLIRMPNTADAVTPTAYPGVFTGVPNNGNITLGNPTPLVAGQFYSIGNPYPSPISASSFIAGTTGLGTTLYFWRKTNGTANTFVEGSSTGTAYATWNTIGGTRSSGDQIPNNILPNGQIAVGQGFIVNTGTATTINFTNTMRTGTAATFFKTKATATPDRVWLNLTNATGAFSQTLIGYTANATLGVDNGIDGEYINDSPLALTSNIDNKEYTIQGRPTFDPTDVVALNFKTAVAGDYTIAIDQFDGVFASGQDIFLADSKTGTETDLKAGSYTFNATAGTDNTRFSLKYQKTLKVDSPAFDENSVTVYKNNGTLYVNSGKVAINSIQVYDVQGRLIAERKNVNSSTATLENLKANNQVLLVKISGEDNSVVTKKVVN